MPERRRKPRRGDRPRTAGTLRDALDAIAPLADAEEWDNVGMLAGRPEWPAEKVLVALDLTDAVAREALSKQVDALVLYHPPIHKGILKITPDAAGPTSLLPDLLAARIAILATHTAFDAAEGGINDLLLDLFEPASRRPLRLGAEEDSDYKLAVFVPAEQLDALRRALSEAGAGVIGRYEQCSFEIPGRGTFRGDETTNPTIGRRRVLERVDEIRLEMIAPRRQLGEIVRALYAAHSYEEPAFDLYPVHGVRGRAAVGMGRVGELVRPIRGAALMQLMAKKLDLSVATTVGDLRRSFRSVTTAAGAFGVRDFRDSDSLYVTGEFKHHDALQLLRRGVTAICLGHYASERLALDNLKKRLARMVKGVRISIARSDRSPFQAVKRKTN